MLTYAENIFTPKPKNDVREIWKKNLCEKLIFSQVHKFEGKYHNKAIKT